MPDFPFAENPVGAPAETFTRALAIIRTYRRQTVAFARAVRDILDAELWRHGYASVEAFADIEVGCSRSRLYQYRDLAVVADNLGEAGEHLLESHARELSRLGPEQQRELYARLAGGGAVRVTAARLRDAVDLYIEAASRPAHLSVDAEQARFLVRPGADADAVPADAFDFEAFEIPERPRGHRPRHSRSFGGTHLVNWSPLQRRVGAHAPFWQLPSEQERQFVLEADLLGEVPEVDEAHPVVVLDPAIDLFGEDVPEHVRSAILEAARAARQPLAVFTADAARASVVPEGVLPVVVAPGGEALMQAHEVLPQDRPRAVLLCRPAVSDVVFAAEHFDWVVVGDTAAAGVEGASAPRPLVVTEQENERLEGARASLLFLVDLHVKRRPQAYPQLSLFGPLPVEDAA